jgi:hypothetical protein
MLRMTATTKGPILLTAPLGLRQSADNKLPAQFSGVAYSGEPIASYGVVIDVSTTDVPRRMPLLLEHNREDMIGVVDDARGRDGQVVASGRLFSDIPESSAERVAHLARRGAPYQMSLGVFSYTEEAIPAGRSVSVNGRTVPGPIVVLRQGKVREVSVCTLGADPNTSASFFSASNSRASEIAALFAIVGLPPTPQRRAALLRMKAAEFAALRELMLDVRARSMAIEQVVEAATHKPAADYMRKRREQALGLTAAAKSGEEGGRRLSLWERRRAQAAAVRF